MKPSFTISLDKDKLDLDLIHRFLSEEAYWSKGRSRATIEKSIQHAMCFGVYEGDKQVAFARVVSDFAVFAWILDVFVLEAYRGKGIGKLLMQAIRSHPELQGLTRWGLNTLDAHGLYQQFGFQPLSNPEIHMEISAFAQPLNQDS